MPLNRFFDLTILIIRSQIYFRERYKIKDDVTKLDRIGLQGGALNVELCAENDQLKSDIELFDECLRKDDEILAERLNVIKGLLSNLDEM